jgi:hypothetical protein
MPTKLKDIEVAEGTLCHVGKNEEAKIVLFKRGTDDATKGGENMEKDLKTRITDFLKSLVETDGGEVEDEIPDEKGEEDMPNEQDGSPEVSADEVAKLRKENEELKTKVAELSKAEPEDITKGMDDEVKKAFEDLRKELAAEREIRVSREFSDKARDLTHIGSAEDVAKMLRKAYEADAEYGTSLEEKLRAAEAKIAEAEVLTSEIGGSGQAPTDAEAKLEKMAHEKAKADGIAYENAYADILKTEEGTALYAQIQNERSKR